MLLQAEQIARERAFAEWYEERCDAHNSILVDATDLDVRSVAIEWARCRAHLLIILNAYSRSGQRVRTFRWRVHVPTAIGSAFDQIVKRGLKDQQ